MLESNCSAFLQIGGGGVAAGGGGIVTTFSPVLPPLPSSSKLPTERLWKEFFRDPSLWWDKRLGKTNPNAPDFTHKGSREALWLDAWDNPSWVYQMLKGRDLIKQASLQESLPTEDKQLYSNAITAASLQIAEDQNTNGNIRVDAHGTLNKKKIILKGKVPNIAENSHGKDPSLIEGLLKREEEARSSNNRDSKEYDDIYWENLSFEEALLSLENASHPPPSIPTIYSVLRRCTKEKKHAYAAGLLAYVRQRGLETHTLLGNQLVLILSDAGNMLDAQQVFEGLSHRRKRSWNFLIVGYSRLRKPQHALLLYERMQEESSADPDPFTFVALIKSCAELKDEETGSKVHKHIIRTGLLKTDGVLGNALVNMYIKFNLLAKAQEVFDKLPLRNVISWNTLIAGYAKYGHEQEALNYLERMQLEGFSPNVVTYICIMKACGRIEDMKKGVELHAEIARQGLLETDLHVGGALVDMYAKGGFLAKAQEVFDLLPRKDIVSWNALIAGYVQHECCEEALKYFRRLQAEGIPPNAATLISCLKACGNIGAVEEGREIHNQVDRNGWLGKDSIVGCAVVNMYVKCGLFAEAQEVFDNLSNRDVISWTALITGYAEHGYGEEALDCFKQMQIEGICPNAITFISSLKACGIMGAIHEGQEIHTEAARKGWLKNDSFLNSAMVDMYAKCGLLLKAQEVFDKIKIRNVVCWNALITGYAQFGHGKDALECLERMQLEGILPDAVTYVCSLKACGIIGDTVKGRRLHSQFMKEGLMGGYLAAGNGLIDMYTKCGLLTEAQEVFDQLPVQDIVSWNALLAGYAQNEFGEKALDCYDQMQLESFSPDIITYVSSLRACGSIGALTKGEEIHAEIAKDETLERDPAIGNALVDMYTKCGSRHKAQEVFESLINQDTVAWTALIAGYAQLGESKIVFDAFKRMEEEGIKPNLITFVGVLNASSHAGLVDKGETYFEAMSEIYDIVPISEHHTCMVDLLCRAGQLECAVCMIEKTHLLLDLTVWHTLLGACRTWNNVKLGREAFEHVMQLDSNNIAACVSMYNIYTGAGMKEEVANMVPASKIIERPITKEQVHCWWTDPKGIVLDMLDEH